VGQIFSLLTPFLQIWKGARNETDIIASCIRSLILLKTLRLAISSDDVIQEENNFWTSISGLNNLNELHLELRFFRTATVNFTNLRKLNALKNLKKMILVFENKRNNQSFCDFWTAISSISELSTFWLSAKHFKIVLPDLETLNNNFQIWKNLKKLFLQWNDIEYTLDKQHYKIIGLGISLLSDKLEELRIRLPYSFPSDPNLILPKRAFPNLIKFEYSGSILETNKEAYLALGAFLGENLKIKKLRFAVNHIRRKKYQLPVPDDCRIQPQQLEMICDALIKLTDLQKLKLIIGQCKNFKDLSSFNLISKMLSNMKALKIFIANFGLDYLKEHELRRMLTIFNSRVFRFIELKGEYNNLKAESKQLIQALNKKYKEIKNQDKKEESTLEKLEKYEISYNI